RVLPLLAAELLPLQTVRAAGFLLRAVVAVAAHSAFQPDVFAHAQHSTSLAARICERAPRARRCERLNGDYARILVTTPAPTVRPPSRMAKRSPSSMAIGISGSSSTVIWMLSPGMHISTPDGSVTLPVTSVVRK